MTEVDKRLSDILEVEYSPTKSEETSMITISDEDKCIVEVSENTQIPDRDVEYDYEYSRETHRELIDRGLPALEELLSLAKASQHPRAYEVAANMMKSISDMTDKLMTLHKSRKELESNKQTPVNATQVNANTVVFAGTTSDLLKKIRAK